MPSYFHVPEFHVGGPGSRRFDHYGSRVPPVVAKVAQEGLTTGLRPIERETTVEALGAAGTVGATTETPAGLTAGADSQPTGFEAGDHLQVRTPEAE